jgi:hypothetical protein
VTGPGQERQGGGGQRREMRKDAQEDTRVKDKICRNIKMKVKEEAVMDLTWKQQTCGDIVVERSWGGESLEITRIVQGWTQVLQFGL